MDPRKLSLKELVSYCLDSQDEAAWTEFVRRFQPLIAGIAVKCVLRRPSRKPAPIDDLVQDTFVKLCDNIARLCGTLALRMIMASSAF
jgi:RNA polymerase sigma-70 factor, ECF subfamily